MVIVDLKLNFQYFVPASLFAVISIYNLLFKIPLILTLSLIHQVFFAVELELNPQVNIPSCL